MPKIKDFVSEIMIYKTQDCYTSDVKAITIDKEDKKGLTFGRVPFVLSSNAVDRQGEVVNPKGIDLKNFKKNPIVAWAHKALGTMFEPPHEDDIIGKVDQVSLEKTDTKLTGDVLFNLTLNEDGSSKDVRGTKIFNKLNAGILNAGSIGFRSIKRSEKNAKEGQTGVTHVKSELIEFSIVPLGANPEALRKILINANPQTKEEIYKELVSNIPKNDIDLFLKNLVEIPEIEQVDIYDKEDEEEIEKDLTELFADTVLTDDIEIFVNTSTGNFTEKAGRVLSTRNENKMKEAKDLIIEVLDSLPEKTTEESEGGDREKSIVDKTEPVIDRHADDLEVVKLNKNKNDNYEITNLD